ncbi:MAG: metal-dependent hydrolase [Spirochaetes bacterium]|nr:metal-dependent hydrolase [Spirochaetota bacterium]MBN2771088.1 metal-dependent hydrolase [Spirochaetota bacterium]
MDIITHTLSGVAAGTAVANFSRNGISDKTKIVLFAGFGAFIPDLDALSLWSGFDSTIGSILNLVNSGKNIYFAKLWYSHHAFMHSLPAGVFLAVLLSLLTAVLSRFGSNNNGISGKSFKEFLIRQKFIFLAFMCGYIMHLLGDLPTPSCVWGGVNMFWPLKTYVGGTGDIWWWNNYDIFIIALVVSIINCSVILTGICKTKSYKCLTLFVFTLGFFICLYQIKNRDANFNYIGHTPDYHIYEEKSKKIQKDILGEYLYNIMDKLDKKIPLYF